MCYYCEGKLPVYGTGLDRLNSSKGYENTNVVPCCTACNRVRGAVLSVDNMLEIKQFLIRWRLEREELIAEQIVKKTEVEHTITQEILQQKSTEKLYDESYTYMGNLGSIVY